MLMTLEAPDAIARTITPEQAAIAPCDGASMKSPTRLIEIGDFTSRKPKEFMFVESLWRTQQNHSR